ncbi:hypothetical protein HPB51_009728 [Rhipicephalus microplus]|uniref:Uncharacterized protein n=1 Tax=Rhipicephalus microplus TaxID=6941 RepID=A0A9J6D4C4_RHIMP|nr:hypothetical protein HPB51_009728 [Rhipicephalus microplus]
MATWVLATSVPLAPLPPLPNSPTRRSSATAGSQAPYIAVMDVQSPEIPPSTSSSTGIASRKREHDGYLKSAEALVKELTKCTSCRSRGEAEEEKRGAAKKMCAIDQPAVLKQIVSATLPTSADAHGPQRTCHPHHESPDLRVTPHLQAEKEQGPWPEYPLQI